MARVLLHSCLIALLGTLGCSGAGIVPTSGDADEAYAVHAFIDEAFQLPAAMYAGPGVRASGITIYGVTDRAEQDQIIHAVEAERPRRGWKPVILVFKEREVWRTSRDGLTSARGRETVLRRHVSSGAEASTADGA